MDRAEKEKAYMQGFRDAMRELLDVLEIALNDAVQGDRLPAVERVLAEYKDRFPKDGNQE